MRHIRHASRHLTAVFLLLAAVTGSPDEPEPQPAPPGTPQPAPLAERVAPSLR
jgi:hypothetical protein